MNGRPFDFPGRRDGVIDSFAVGHANGAEANGQTKAGTPEDEERIYHEITSTAHLGGAALFPVMDYTPLSEKELQDMSDFFDEADFEPTTHTTDMAETTVVGEKPVVNVSLPEHEEEVN